MAAIAAASTSIAATALFTTLKAAPFSCPALPYLLPPRVSSTPFSTSFKVSESKRSSLLQVKASSSEEPSVDASEFLTELKEKWDALKISRQCYFTVVGQLLQFGCLQLLLVPSTQFLCYRKSWSW